MFILKLRLVSSLGWSERTSGDGFMDVLREWSRIVYKVN